MAGALVADAPAEGVLRLRIANPAKRGALDDGLLAALADAVADPGDARCVLLTGEGAHFSSGYDLGALRPGEDPFAAQHPFARALAALDAADVPTLAALNGHAAGGALELALACDLRVAAEHARLVMPPVRLGVAYAPGGLRRFVAAVGVARTRELFLLGRPLDAPTALAWGLVGSVVAAEALEEAAVGLARELAAGAPLAVRGTKRALRALEARLDPAEEEALAALRREAFASEDLREGVRAFAERRPARFTGR